MEIDDNEYQLIDYPYITEDNNHFSVLNNSDLKRLQNTDIDHISSILSLPKASASLLLTNYNWNITRVLESWFDNERKVQKTIGLSSNNSQIVQLGFRNSIKCDICFENFSKDDIKSSWCGHPFCIDCWNQYIDTNIDDRNCFILKCPQPSCNAAVDEDMIHRLASESRKIKYDEFLLRSYVENNSNRKFKWCPAPNCDYAINYELPDSSSSLNYDVTCVCYHSFCWECGDEAHTPVDCETVAKWRVKINSNSEIRTTNEWIIVNTKPCPICKIPIQKSVGCKLMRCKLCNNNFCWLCLRDMHTCKTEGCKELNVVQVQQFQQEKYGDDLQMSDVIYRLEKYNRCCEGWGKNESLRTKALLKLTEIGSTVYIKKVSISREKPECYFDFIKSAWKQIVEGRRILKWADVYEYYLPENEKAKIEFFQHIQRTSHDALDKLQCSAEIELAKVLNDGSELELCDFRLKLINQTSVTKKYFKNLVKELENGLDVVSVKNYTGVKRVSSEIGDNNAEQKRIRSTMHNMIRNGFNQRLMHHI